MSSSSSSSHAFQNVLLGAALGSSTLLLALYWEKIAEYLPSWCLIDSREKKAATMLRLEDRDIYPPMPKIIVDILNASRLAFLATTQDDSPHLSLMNFTYYQQEESIIISTRRDTKKFKQIQENPKIALLIHDFPHLDGTEGDDRCGRSFSITMNGTAKIIDAGDVRDLKYRQIHQLSNPDYKQFIVGESIAIIVLQIEKARCCDINDKVSYWDVKKDVSENNLQRLEGNLTATP